VSVAKNPPSFIVVDSVTGRVGYTKRATGMGNEAIASCAARAKELARKTGNSQIVVLELMKRFVGQQLNVGILRTMGITEEIHPDGRVTRNNPRRAPVRRNIFTFNNPPSGPADPTAVRELQLYIENDRDLYHQQFIPIVKNLMLKRRKGVYDREKAVKLFMYLMESGAKKYVAEFGTRGQKIDAMFNKNTRLQAARAFRDSFETEAELGNYDRLIGPVSNPGRESTRRVKAFYCHCGRRVELEGSDTQCQKCGQWYNSFGQRLKDPSEWTENPGRVRKNIFVFNNPKRPLNAMESAAAAVGLLVTTWAPGDGMTRFRFFKAKRGERYADYHQGDALYTANGRGEAMKFIQSYGIGRGLKNPLTRAEAGQELMFARGRMQQAADLQRAGHSPSYDLGYAQGITGVVGRRSTRRAAQVAERVTRHIRYNPAVCSNPIVRGDKLPQRLQDEALRRYIYRWTTGNTQRGSSYGYCPHCKTPGGKPSETNIACRQIHPTIPLITDAEWLRTHAFHITKDGRFSEKHNHAEPGYMADDEGGPVRRNPLLQTIMLANPGSVKTFNEMQGVGKAKYVVNYHDGVKVHRDGSPFFDIAIFSSLAKKDRFVRKLESLGFTRSTFRNPPISAQWDRLGLRQRLELLEIVGYPEEVAGSYALDRWSTLSASAKRAIERGWFDSSAPKRGGTTRRRAVPVGANPLTRREAGIALRSAREDLRHGSSFRSGDFTRQFSAGKAYGKAQVVNRTGPRASVRAAAKIQKRAEKSVGTTLSNPGGLKLPAPGTKMTVAQAMELARRIGDRGLIRECQAAAKLQKVSDRDTKCVIWKHLPMGSKDKIDSVVALAHYGDSPEDMYRPPKGSKKGPHMYRHKWKKSVPVLASPSGKMIVKVMGPGQKVGDWMRG
jgi:hypothetical protein